MYKSNFYATILVAGTKTRFQVGVDCGRTRAKKYYF